MITLNYLATAEESGYRYSNLFVDISGWNKSTEGAHVVCHLLTNMGSLKVLTNHESPLIVNACSEYSESVESHVEVETETQSRCHRELSQKIH